MAYIFYSSFADMYVYRDGVYISEAFLAEIFVESPRVLYTFIIKTYIHRMKAFK